MVKSKLHWDRQDFEGLKLQLEKLKDRLSFDSSLLLDCHTEIHTILMCPRGPLSLGVYANMAEGNTS